MRCVVTAMRILALLSQRPRSPEVPDLLDKLRRSGGPGWGIAWYFNGGAQVEKSGLDAADDGRFAKACASADSNVIVAHVGSGSVPPEDQQPFVFGERVFAAASARASRCHVAEPTAVWGTTSS